MEIEEPKDEKKEEIEEPKDEKIEMANQTGTFSGSGKKAKHTAFGKGEEKTGKTWKILHGLIDKCESLGEIISSCKSENADVPDKTNDKPKQMGEKKPRMGDWKPNKCK